MIFCVYFAFSIDVLNWCIHVFWIYSFTLMQLKNWKGPAINKNFVSISICETMEWMVKLWTPGGYDNPGIVVWWVVDTMVASVVGSMSDSMVHSMVHSMAGSMLDSQVGHCFSFSCGGWFDYSSKSQLGSMVGSKKCSKPFCCVSTCEWFASDLSAK